MALKVVDGTEKLKGEPPLPPYGFERVLTVVAGGGFGLSGTGFLQLMVEQY